MTLDAYDVPGSDDVTGDETDDETGETGGAPRALGFVVEADRGSLPFHLIHGEALVAAAAWAAGEAEIDLVDLTVPWEAVADEGLPVVLHDPLCPMTPPAFLAACLRTAVAQDAVVVGTRPVTDTVKQVADGRLGATVDRDTLVAVCSPVVLPARVVAELPGLPTTDFAGLVDRLRASYDVVWADAPAEARRVADDEDLRVLAALTDPR
ncbi:2-C-methyl-D-erythritol 4-phosphate cytidylyltransferase [Nocardioides sp. TF02-7]|uniref:2-C-methyl-D-erythritol 4-phosphate cytidylyltransferase n=1 Tax=Nocardioides sp. TF02-7 TaxID=2917724 RepID=UPI001F060C2C|nr:2-C-methyl-D-erythritol 4-phosphate cytidylyltransferase [Nocardioides sp. TF02-7]UMG91325.1 2-C-methyl-D-erythritol 4-phosphate cytidylyltransferase [Nocardioides sp. TF02-7]